MWQKQDLVFQVVVFFNLGDVGSKGIFKGRKSGLKMGIWVPRRCEDGEIRRIDITTRKE